MKPKSHAQLMHDADPARHGRRIFDADYNAMRRTPGTASAALERLRSTNRWKQLRLHVLGREPLCRECLRHDVVRSAVAVDHVVAAANIVAQRGNEAFFDPKNLQPLCTACHAAKTAVERGARRVHSKVAASPMHAPENALRERCQINATGATQSDLFTPTSRGSTNHSNDAGEGVISGGLTHYGGRAPLPHFSRVSPPFARPTAPSQVPPPSEVTPTHDQVSRTPESDPR
jgi:5-methylcytosine-specific restriction endonuclease McrA